MQVNTTVYLNCEALNVEHWSGPPALELDHLCLGLLGFLLFLFTARGVAAQVVIESKL
jgi:hypothetical protein